MIYILKPVLTVIFSVVITSSLLADFLTRNTKDIINNSSESKSVPTSSSKKSYKYRKGQIFRISEEYNDKNCVVYFGKGKRFAYFEYKCDPEYKFVGVTAYGAVSGDNMAKGWFGSNGQIIELVYKGKAHKAVKINTSPSIKGWTGKKCYFNIPVKDNVKTVRVRFKADSSNRISISTIKLKVIPVSTENNRLTVIKKGYDINAWFRGMTNQEKNGYVEAKGYGLVLAKKLLGEGDFSIYAKLQFKKIDQTAATFYFNGNHFGFDGSSGKHKKKCFLEGPDIKERQHQLATLQLTPGEPVIFEVKRQGRFLSFFINSKKAASIKTNTKDAVLFGFRPHRNTIKIFDFYATGNIGEEAGEDNFIKHSSIKQNFPVIVKPVPINKPLKLKIRSTDGKNIKLQLIVGENKPTPAILLPVLASANGSYIILSPELLKKTYNNGEGRFLMRSVRAQIKTIKNKANAEYAFGLFDPNSRTAFPQSKIAQINGRSRMIINGQPQPDMISYQLEEYGRFLGQQTSGFYASGIKLFRFLFVDYFYWDKPAKPNVDKIYNAIQSAMLRMLTHAPKARMIMTWYLYAPPQFCIEYPEEAIKFANNGKRIRTTPGKFLQPSYASPKWRKIRKKIFTEVIRKIKASPWADRFVGIQLAYGNAGEWNNWGYHKKTFPDFSRPMQKTFGNWLKNKYNNVETLRQVWKKASAEFCPAVPGRENRVGKANYFFRDLEKEYPTVDYYEFWQDFTVSTIECFAKHIKDISDNRLLVGAYYGYYLGHLAQGQYHFHDSGHYGVVKYLNSPYLDFLCAPYPYRKRLISCPLNYIFSSVTLHNKLMYTENDQRTQRSGKSNIIYGTTSSLEESIEILKRDFGLNLLKGGSYCFTDFVRGWYQDKEYLDAVKKLHEIEPAILNTQSEKAQVAVFVGESGIPYIASHAGHALNSVYETLRKAFDQAGAPYDLFYAEDIEKIDFKGYKFVIFLNCGKFNDSQLDVINKKVKSNKRCILMLYAPGIIGDKGIDLKRMQKVSGIKIEMLANEKINSIKMPALGKYASLKVYKPFGPLFAVKDSSVKVLGKINDKYVGVCRKKFDDYTVFYVAYVGLSSAWLKYFYKQSKVHMYLNSVDTFFANEPFYCLYTRNAGERELTFPSKCEVIYDLYNDIELGRDTNKIKIKCPEQAETKLIYAGKLSVLRKNN